MGSGRRSRPVGEERELDRNPEDVSQDSQEDSPDSVVLGFDELFDAIEALVNLVKAFIHLLETLVNLVKTQIDGNQLFSDLGLKDPRLQLEVLDVLVEGFDGSGQTVEHVRIGSLSHEGGQRPGYV